MSECSRCDGSGQETFFDDKWESHPCYHCWGSGKVDSETAFTDSLSAVARRLAFNTVNQMQADQDSNPDGEGWDFVASENMMSGYEYFCSIMNRLVVEYMDQLLEMDREKQEVLVAWNNLPVSQKSKTITTPVVDSNLPEADWSDCDNEIPF